MTTKQAQEITRNSILTMIITIPHHLLSSGASKLGKKESWDQFVALMRLSMKQGGLLWIVSC